MTKFASRSSFAATILLASLAGLPALADTSSAAKVGATAARPAATATAAMSEDAKAIRPAIGVQRHAALLILGVGY